MKKVGAELSELTDGEVILDGKEGLHLVRLEERRGSGIRMPFLIRATGDQGKILVAEL